MEVLVWEIPAERMKMKRPHLISIQGRTLELFTQAKMHGQSGLKFPNMRSGKEFSYNAPMVVLKKLGVENLRYTDFGHHLKHGRLRTLTSQHKPSSLL